MQESDQPRPKGWNSMMCANPESNIPSNYAYGANPKVAMRGIWKSPRSYEEGDNYNAVGSGIAFDFGEYRLVITVLPNLSNWTGKPKKRELARNPQAHGLQVRWIPKEIALEELPPPENHIDGVPQFWESYDHIGDWVSIEERKPMKWHLELASEGLLLKPERADPLYHHAYLRLCRNYKVNAATTSRPHVDRYLKVCRAYGKDWLEVRSVDYFKPIGRSVHERSQLPTYDYPKTVAQGWGWLRPDSPCQLQMQGLVFKSIYAWAVNPTLWIKDKQAGSLTDDANLIISERLAAGARARLEQDAVWREQITRWGTPLKNMASKAPRQHQAYWAEILKFAQSQSVPIDPDAEGDNEDRRTSQP